jgi:leucyl aminopeptidase
MQVESFYQTTSESVLPLILLTKNTSLDTLSVFEKNCLLSRQFSGKVGEVVVINDIDGNACKVYIGAGDGDEVLALSAAVMKLPIASYHVSSGLTNPALLAWSLAQYGFDHYKKSAVMPRVLIVEPALLADILMVSRAIFFVRDLINRPANDLGPNAMADVLETLAHTYDATFRQWVGDELIHDNFPAIHAVGRAADEAPRLLSLIWGDESHPRVTLIGKGVCFDSGGLNLKPPANMRMMKKDMGGAAHVIGLAQWLMAYQLPIRLTVLIPAVENAVGAGAYRPGDVLTMRNGLTVEIDNTDAEGRLVLADAIVKACEDSPEVLMDFSTLTGAARVAVGTDIAAFFTNDDALASSISESATVMNDAVWRMPLFMGYDAMLESSIADMVNSSPSAYAGAITAALFLKRFVSPSQTWIHFDIMAWNLGNKPGRPEGGEAMGLLAVGHYLINRYGTKNTEVLS